MINIKCFVLASSLLFVFNDLSIAQRQTNNNSYVEQSKSIALFYILLNQEFAPTIAQTSLIFHSEIEWIVAQDVYRDSLQAYYAHINADENNQPSLLFKRIREIRDRLQYGKSEAYQSPRFSILQIEQSVNSIKVVFPCENDSMELVFTFASYPIYYQTMITDITFRNGESVLKLIGAR